MYQGNIVVGIIFKYKISLHRLTKVHDHDINFYVAILRDLCVLHQQAMFKFLHTDINTLCNSLSPMLSVTLML